MTECALTPLTPLTPLAEPATDERPCRHGKACAKEGQRSWLGHGRNRVRNELGGRGCAGTEDIDEAGDILRADGAIAAEVG